MIKNDPIGTAIKDYLQGKKKGSITVSCNLTEDDIIPVDYLFRQQEEMPELETIALEACHGHVLDVGAGAGCHSLLLQERGLQVTAIDISEGAVEAMRGRGIENVLLGDVKELNDQKYDTLLMLMNGIGIVGDLFGLYKFLVHAKTILNPGGQILLESSDILYMYEQEDGSVLLDLNAGYYGEVEYKMKYKTHESDTFKWLFIDAGLLEQYAEEHGFTMEVLYEGENGNFLAKLVLQW
ncbi:class I SAM-dependent methyltransferase [Pontibacter fetidus]|uniref:Class I SAM-dependent methyltransferase n=1 Tax=Pontibacter fetidus TaxID=2700082 RepID=A0A6B2H6L6_9BACT|nr:class I SAM-dependent methyltransferase [Pontibacter fetidus]NDK56017.1 class I SAM-dependent methyltransferase [Pontibacter fetidus]